VLVAAADTATGQISTINVNSADDAPDVNLADSVCEANAGQGNCTLRAAIQNANKAADANTITLAPATNYRLDELGTDDTAVRGDLDLAHSITIDGSRSSIDATGLGDRAVEVLSGATVTINKLTILGGTLSAGSGAGISVSGRLDLTDTVVRNNSATSGTGGGIYFAAGSSGGTLTQSAVLSNTAATSGAGIRTHVPITVRWSTIANNNAVGVNEAAGVFSDVAQIVTLRSTILANGTDVNCNGPVLSEGYNLANNSSCSLAGTGDQQGVEPNLFYAIVPVAPSPAIDRGGLGCPSSDLFGAERPRGVACEVGASEVPHASLAVNSSQDADDANRGNGVCETSLGSANCTLRAAVREANVLYGPDTIVLQPETTYPLTLPGAEDASVSGDLDILGALVLEGNGSSVVASGTADRVFEVRPAGSATLRNVTVSGGTAPSGKSGGGIFVNGGSITLEGAAVTHNSASATYGGGIFFNNSATAGSISDSLISSNVANRGGGISTYRAITLVRTRVVDNTAPIGAALQALKAGQPITLSRSLINRLDGAADCRGPVITTGFNVATDTSCTLTDITDKAGVPRDLSEAEYRKSLAVLRHAEQPSPPVSGYTWEVVEARMARAFAAYLTNDPAMWAVADSDMQYLESAGYPTYGTGWIWGEFTSPLLFRLATISADAWSHVADGVGEPVNARLLVNTMLRRFVDDPLNCDFDSEWGSLSSPDPWYNRGTENHELVRRANCLLGLYALRTEPGYNDPAVQTKRHWTHWAEMLGRFLEERARNGLLNEIQSPNYSGISLSSINNLADFPTGTQLGDELRRVARAFLDLYWHDVAHSFNAITGPTSAGTHRIYPWDPDGPEPTASGETGHRYADPTDSVFFEWLYMYDWHNAPGVAGGITQPQLLTAADSDYVPHTYSKILATSASKSYEYSSMRPSLYGITSAQLYSQGGNLLRRDVSTTANYVIGAMTYGLDARHTGSEAPSFGVSMNTESQDRILISGIASNKPSQSSVFADYFAVQGTASRDVVLAGRNFSAGRPPINCPEDPLNPWHNPPDFWARTDCDGNSRGIRIHLGDGALRDNLEVPADRSQWFFTQAGAAYAAIRVADPGASLVLDSLGRVSQIRLDNLSDGSGSADIWQPVVVQMGSASTYGGSFQAFKADVLDQPFAAGPSGLTYRSLGNDLFAMSRQQVAPTFPQINGADVDVTPTFVYQSPYFSMPWSISPVAPLAAIGAPGMAPVNVDVDWSP
jgi:hypothetical protein